MSDLHLALLLLGAVALVALYGYGKWQQRQALRRMDRSMRQQVGDALLDAPPADSPMRAPAQRIEPRLSIPGKPQAAGATPEPQSAPPASPAGSSPHWVEDPLLDCVLELGCAHAVDGVSVIDAAAALARAQLPLPLYLVAWDARAQQWVQPDRFGFYSELLVAVQLANRRHVLDEVEASRFVSAVQQLALALDADFDPPEVARIVARAQQLDRVSAPFDVQIGLTLVAQGAAWDAQALRRAAEQAGLTKIGELRWQRFAAGSGAVPLFELSCACLPADRLALEFDVPRVPPEAEPLRELFACADQLAAALGASVVDDNGRPIDPGSMPAIAGQLDRLYAEMRAAGIEPGSLRARRLYV